MITTAVEQALPPGREPGAVPRILQVSVVGFSLSADNSIHANDELDSLQLAVREAVSRDVVVFVLHLDASVEAWLEENGSGTP